MKPVDWTFAGWQRTGSWIEAVGLAMVCLHCRRTIHEGHAEDCAVVKTPQGGPDPFTFRPVPEGPTLAGMSAATVEEIRVMGTHLESLVDATTQEQLDAHLRHVAEAYADALAGRDMASAALKQRVTRDGVRAVITAEVARIEGDSRYKQPTALVQINAPLALIQVGMKSAVEAYRVVLAAMDRETGAVMLTLRGGGT